MLAFGLLILVQPETIEALPPVLDIGLEGDSHPQSAVCNKETDFITRRCSKHLLRLSVNPFPWCAAAHGQRGDLDLSQSIVEDPMDCINHVCEIFDQFQNCLVQHDIPEVCIFTRPQYARLPINFHFICQLKRKSTDMLTPLRCLQENRLLDLLLFHLTDRHGVNFLDPYVQGNKNALFRFLNVESMLYTFFISPEGFELLLSQSYICFPQNILDREILSVGEETCGAVAARIASDYYLTFRRIVNAILKQVGLSVNVCEDDHKGIQSEIVEERNPESEDEEYGRTRTFHTVFDQFHEFLEYNSAGTVLDTLYGHDLRRYIKGLSASEFCDPFSGLIICTRASNLLSRDESVKSVSNIIYFAHAETIPFMDYPQESSMEGFNSCWNLLAQICSTNTSYFDYIYTVISGTADIQLMMDNLTCKWQDTLIKGYIQASKSGNLWPPELALVYHPLHLTSSVYSRGSITGSLPDLIASLDKSIKGIAAKCGGKAARCLQRFFEKLNYAWYSYTKLLYMEQIYF